MGAFVRAAMANVCEVEVSAGGWARRGAGSRVPGKGEVSSRLAEHVVSKQFSRIYQRQRQKGSPGEVVVGALGRWTLNVVTRDESKQSSGPSIALAIALPSPPLPFGTTPALSLTMVHCVAFS